jgi:hypothetical protein
MGGSFVISICTNQEKGQSMQVGTKIVHMQTSYKPNPQNMLEPKLGKKKSPILYFLIVYFVNNNEGCTIVVKGVAQFLIRNLEIF